MPKRSQFNENIGDTDMKQIGYREFIGSIDTGSKEKILVKGHKGEGKTEFIRKLCHIFEYDNEDTRFAILSNDMTDSIDIARDRMPQTDIVTIDGEIYDVDFDALANKMFSGLKEGVPIIIIADWKLTKEIDAAEKLIESLDKYKSHVLVISAQEDLQNEDAYEYVIEFNNDKSYRFKVYTNK